MAIESSDAPSIDHLDWSRALNGVNGDSDLLKELVQIFLDEVPNWLDQLRRSITARDVDSSRRAAHTAKGAVSQLGMSVATDLAQRLENGCRNSQFDVAEALYKDFDLEIVMLKPHQLRFLESTPSS